MTGEALPLKGGRSPDGELAQALVDQPIAGVSRRRRLVIATMRHFHAQDRLLAELTHRQRLGLSPATLKRYARSIPLAFRDYVPMKLRPKKAASQPTAENGQ